MCYTRGIEKDKGRENKKVGKTNSSAYLPSDFN